MEKLELKNYSFNNRHYSGTSYCSAEEKTDVIKFVDVEDVAKSFTNLINQFDQERKSEFCRWERNHNLSWHVHTQSLDYESNLNNIKGYIEEDGVYSCSGAIPNMYEIEIKKVGNNFQMEVITFVHICWCPSVLQWLSEDAIKDALINKMKYLKGKVKS
mgnify:CR=1 FL=1